MQSLQIIDNLSALGERQGAALNTAIELVIRCLRANKIPFSLQDIRIDIPIERSAILTIDGKEAPCKATSFVSGLIQGKDVVLSSAMPMAESPNLPNINVNPYCSEISRGNHYCSPAIAVSPRTLQKIFDGKNIAAAVEIERSTQDTVNVLVGNTDTPQAIVFTHIDSIGPGACDNASGVGVLLDIIVSKAQALENTLFVLSGNEELSYEKPYYWGAGYRGFARQYVAAMQSASSIVVVDSVGNGITIECADLSILQRAFPIGNNEVLQKTTLLTGSLNALMNVYHSELDTADLLCPRAVQNTVSQLERMLLA